MSLLPRLMRKLICSQLLRHDQIYPVRGRETKTLYLTFDDGPHPVHTKAVLDLLARYQILATFFVNGDKLAGNPEVGRQVVQQGHLLGNHTYSHRTLTRISREARRREIHDGQSMVRQFQQHGLLFRPPQGLLYPKDLLWLIRGRHTVVMWSVDSGDSFHLAAAQIEERLRQAVKRSEVILFHDDSDLCIRVLERMIPLWQSQGFSFSTIC